MFRREPCPCEGCPNAIRCGAEQLACSVFARYVSRATGVEHPTREPNKHWYRVSMGGFCARCRRYSEDTDDWEVRTVKRPMPRYPNPVSCCVDVCRECADKEDERQNVAG